VFKLMTWNVENLFRPGETGGPSAASVYDAKLKGLARAINDQQPDALALQEVGDPAALDDLVALLNGTWQRQISMHPDSRGIRVAWLTTRPITDPAEILDFPSRLHRSRSMMRAPRSAGWAAARWPSPSRPTPGSLSG
jgi:hypothetical protein